MDAPFLDLSFYLGRFGTRQFVEKEISTNDRFFILRTNGEAFCGPVRDHSSHLRTIGFVIQNSFVAAAESIDCLYGAILVEYSLETPSELRQDPRSLAFRNFYLSTELLPSEIIEEVLSIIPSGTYINRLRRGTYLSMSTEFNEGNSNVDVEVAQYVSASIGRIIGTILDE